MQNPVLHNPGQVPWKEWELKGDTHGLKKRPMGYIETAFTENDLAVVEVVYAQWTRYPLSSWCQVVEEGYDLLPLTYPIDQHPNKFPHYGEIEIRPNLIRWLRDGHKVAWGSHQEQDYRAYSCVHSEKPDYDKAVERSRELLLEYLTPRQRLDLLTTSSFYVQGTMFETKNHCYRVEYLNGVQSGKTYARTRQGRREYIFRILSSHCYHGNVWLPGYDTMLTTLLLLQENEATFLEESNTSLYKKPQEVPL